MGSVQPERLHPSSVSDASQDLLRRLERLPMSWVQGRLLVQGGLGYTFDAADGAIVAFILPPVVKLGFTVTRSFS